MVSLGEYADIMEMQTWRILRSLKKAGRSLPVQNCYAALL